MTKLEFAERLESYEKKQQHSKRIYFVLGLLCLIFIFIPAGTLPLNEGMLDVISTTLPIFGGFLIGKAWHIQSGTEEKILLVNALELLASDTKT